MRWNSCVRSACARAICSPVSFSPCSMFQITVSLSFSRCCLSSASRSRKPSARSVWKASVAAERSGSASSMVQPSFLNACFCDSSTAVTRESIGKPPRSRLQAMRVLRKLRLSGRLKIDPGSLIAEGDGAGGREPLDDGVVFGGHVIGVDRRAEGGADTFGRDEVLVRDRQARERSDGFLSVHGPGGLQRLLGEERDDGIHLRVHAL